MKEEEKVLKERMGELSRDLAAVSQDLKEKSASLRSVEELKSRTSHLDDEIKQKSEVFLVQDVDQHESWGLQSLKTFCYSKFQI